MNCKICGKKNITSIHESFCFTDVFDTNKNKRLKA